MPFSLRPNRITRARPLLGTRVTIDVGGIANDDAHRAIDAGFAEIARIHRAMSFHEQGSDVGRLNCGAADRPVAVSAATFAVLNRALELAALSGGAFDITVASQLVARGLLPRPRSRRAPDRLATWRDIELLAQRRVRFHRPLWIDLGGIAKGYAVDRAVEIMKLAPAVDCLVDAGGDLRVQGRRARTVFLRVGQHTRDMLPALELENGSMASSGGQWRPKSGGIHVDGRRRRAIPAQDFVSVVARDCLAADALTKIVLARGSASDALLKRFQATAYRYRASDGWRQFGAQS
jgi:thiamine biosynthesis lipoprotein